MWSHMCTLNTIQMCIVTVSTLVLNWKYIYNKLQNMFFNKMFEIFAFFSVISDTLLVEMLQNKDTQTNILKIMVRSIPLLTKI